MPPTLPGRPYDVSALPRHGALDLTYCGVEVHGCIGLPLLQLSMLTVCFLLTPPQTPSHGHEHPPCHCLKPLGSYNGVLSHVQCRDTPAHAARAHMQSPSTTADRRHSKMPTTTKAYYPVRARNPGLAVEVQTWAKAC